MDYEDLHAPSTSRTPSLEGRSIVWGLAVRVKGRRPGLCVLRIAYEEDSDVGGAHAERTPCTCRDRPREGGAVRLEATLKPNRHTIGRTSPSGTCTWLTRIWGTHRAEREERSRKAMGTSRRSRCFGAYPRRQVGWARIMTDRATFAAVRCLRRPTHRETAGSSLSEPPQSTELGPLQILLLAARGTHRLCQKTGGFCALRIPNCGQFTNSTATPTRALVRLPSSANSRAEFLYFLPAARRSSTICSAIE